MIDPKYKVWIVIENEEDEKIAEKIKQNTLDKYPYKSLEVTFKELKPFLHLKYCKYLQIGYLWSDRNDAPILAGLLEINWYKYKMYDFYAETTIDMLYFKPFFKKLTENLQMRNNTRIIIRYYQKEPVWFEIYEQNGNYEKRIGIIVPVRSE